jgi:hypothetical protein
MIPSVEFRNQRMGTVDDVDWYPAVGIAAGGKTVSK